MKAEIEELNKEDEEAAQKLALRSKQFQFLLYALEDLHRTLHKEKETEPTQMEVETKDAISAMQT